MSTYTEMIRRLLAEIEEAERQERQELAAMTDDELLAHVKRYINAAPKDDAQILRRKET
jgi:hypothetical protein